MTSAIVYARYSPRPNAGQCESIETQLERCRAFCAGIGHQVLAEHFDKDLSGARADNRPGLRAAVAEACKLSAVLVVYSLSRLARNVDDARAIAKQLNKSGAELAMIRESIDTSTPMGRAFFTIMAVFDELEREQIGARTSDAMLRHQAAGRRMGRRDRCPYGWRADPENDDRMIEETEEQGVIARIKTERKKGKGLREIARTLDRDGVRCRGNRWCHTTIKNILDRPGP